MQTSTAHLEMHCYDETTRPQDSLQVFQRQDTNNRGEEGRWESCFEKAKFRRVSTIRLNSVL